MVKAKFGKSEKWPHDARPSIKFRYFFLREKLHIILSINDSALHMIVILDFSNGKNYCSMDRKEECI